MLSFTYPNALFTLSAIAWPGTITIGLLLLVLLKRSDFSDRFRVLAVVVLVFNALFLAGVPFQNTRHLLLGFPLMLYVLYPSFVRLANWVHSRVKSAFVLPATLTVLALGLCGYALRPTLQSQQTQAAIASYIEQHAPEARIYTFSIEMALASYGLPNPIENIYHQRYQTFEPGSIMLVNNARFARIFEGRNPMLNWETAQQQGTLELVQAFEGGWELYRIP